MSMPTVVNPHNYSDYAPDGLYVPKSLADELVQALETGNQVMGMEAVRKYRASTEAKSE